MRLSVDLVAAPAAAIRAAARGNEIDGALAVRVAPRFDVAMNVDGTARGPGLVVETSNLRACGVLMQAAVFEIGDAGNIGEAHMRSALQRCEQLLQRRFALAEHNELRARVEILLRIGARLGAADDGLPSS